MFLISKYYLILVKVHLLLYLKKDHIEKISTKFVSHSILLKMVLNYKVIVIYFTKTGYKLLKKNFFQHND